MQKLFSTIFKTGQLAASFLDRVINDSRLGDPSYTGDPYPEYERLLSQGPIVRSYVVGGWCVLDFDTVVELLKDPRVSADLFKNPTLHRMYRYSSDGDSRILQNPLMLNTDPPEHSRLRKLARSGFLHNFVQALEEKIRQSVNQCFLEVEGQTQIDLIDTLARPLPANIISDLIGVETHDWEQFRFMTDAYLRGVSKIEFSSLRRADKAFGEMLEFMEIVVERKRLDRGDDLISALIAAEEDGDKLSAEEVTTMCVLLMSAGYETTTRLIGNAVYLLLKHPEQLLELRKNPELVPNAIEEVLRFEPPVQTLVRIALEDMEVKGRQIKKHQTLILIPAAANRDPNANDNPDKFDITRKNIKHIAFGYGIHLCLGAELARLETKVALEMLLDRYPQIELASQSPKWEPGYVMRGLEELTLRVA